MLVLDANILIRAVLGLRVMGLLRKYAGQVGFMAPDVGSMKRASICRESWRRERFRRLRRWRRSIC